MPTQQLFNELEKITKPSESIFVASGMINKYNKLQYGFFPLGDGILINEIEKKKDINLFKIMVLGNDFGTNEYLIKECPDGKEKDTNTTISNLIKRLRLDVTHTFFTNFHLGVRKEGSNTNRIVRLNADYKNLCYAYFLKQLEIINPEIVLCLGHEVRRSLIENSSLFNDWKPKDATLKELYESGKYQIDINDKELGKRKFIIIPHPSDNRNLNVHIKDVMKTLGINYKK
jgi:hypothetical protein